MCVCIFLCIYKYVCWFVLEKKVKIMYTVINSNIYIMKFFISYIFIFLFYNKYRLFFIIKIIF